MYSPTYIFRKQLLHQCIPNIFEKSPLLHLLHYIQPWMLWEMNRFALCLVISSPGRSFILQPLCLALLRDSVSSRDLLFSRTLLILNRDKCLQLTLKRRGRLGRLRFQTSFSEELVLKRHTTIKHTLSPDTIIHSNLTLCNWLHASLEPGAFVGSESSALRPPTEHSGRILKAPHLHPLCLITISGPTKELPAGWPGSSGSDLPLPSYELPWGG